MCLTCLALAAGLVCLVGPVAAQPWDLLDSGKLLATGGVSQIEGAGGGGLANWTLITGYGTRDGIGANFHYTTVLLPDYRLQSAGPVAQRIRLAGDGRQTGGHAPGAW